MKTKRVNTTNMTRCFAISNPRTVNGEEPSWECITAGQKGETEKGGIPAGKEETITKSRCGTAHQRKRRKEADQGTVVGKEKTK